MQLSFSIRRHPARLLLGLTHRQGCRSLQHATVPRHTDPLGSLFFAPDIYRRELIDVDQSDVAPVGNKLKRRALFFAGTRRESAWPSATLGPREIGTRSETVVLHAGVFTPSWAAGPLELCAGLRAHLRPPTHRSPACSLHTPAADLGHGGHYVASRSLLDVAMMTPVCLHGPLPWGPRAQLPFFSG